MNAIATKKESRHTVLAVVQRSMEILKARFARTNSMEKDLDNMLESWTAGITGVHEPAE
ncbi:MAG: hypothetical protein WC530_09570 [Candidatus Omnitrophota bacterium]